MRRLFTFGCSFTQYWRWPTWADILGRQYDQFENWGICGGGNCQILYNLMECHERHGITTTDTVAIMWTNVSREDRYVRDHWLEGGNVYWGSELGEDYVRRYACERGYLMRDLAVVSAVSQLLATWGCQSRQLAMVPLSQDNSTNQLGEDPTGAKGLEDVYALYGSRLASIAPSVYEVVFSNDWFTGEGLPDSFDSSRRDFHPTPLEHLTYLDRVWPHADISAATREWVARVQDQLKHHKEPEWQPRLPHRL